MTDYNLEDTGKLMTRSGLAGKKKIIIIAAVALIAVILIGVLGIRALGEKRYDDKVAVAEKAMQEGDYAQAESAYLDAVDMNKRKPKAREGLAYVYAIQSRFAEAQKEYQRLYDDTGEEKYRIAAEDTGQGRMPTDSGLAVETPWRQISLDEAPYPVALERFVWTTAWFPESGNYYNCASTPEAPVVGEMFGMMAGYDGTIMTPADEITEDGEYESPWTSYYNEDESEEKWKPDPRGWFEYGYYVCEQEKLEKYLRDIFNFSDEIIEIVRTSGEEYNDHYLQDGYYYRFMPIGGDAVDYQVNTIWTNGRKYCVKYDSILFSYYEDGRDLVDEYYEMLELKNIDGRPYWTMSYNGRKMPEEVTSTPGGEDKKVSSTEAYSAYAEVLRENESAIKEYWWQEDNAGEMYNEYNESYDGAAEPIVNPCVALYDLNGDGVEELLFFRAEQQYEADLHIYTYAGGKALECGYGVKNFNNEEAAFADVAAAGGSKYAIYSGKEKGVFYLAHVITDEWSSYTVSRMSMNGDSIKTVKSVNLSTGPNSDYSATLYEYKIDGNDVNNDQGEDAMSEICSDTGTMILASHAADLNEVLKMSGDSQIAMTYDDAIAKLAK